MQKRDEVRQILSIRKDPGGYRSRARFYERQGYRIAEGRAAMGTTLPMTHRQLGESVPPAYSEFIGRLALRAASLGSFNEADEAEEGE